jgi:hypothetical protein
MSCLVGAYRDRFCRKLKRLAKAGQLKLVGAGEGLDVAEMVEQMLAKKWEVFAKPFDDAKVYEYLVAMSTRWPSQSPPPEAGKDQVSFEYHDNKDGEPEEGADPARSRVHPPLPGARFARRLYPHSALRLASFQRRPAKLPQARQLLGLEPAVPQAHKLELKAWLKEILGTDELDRCPSCGQVNTMFRRAEFSHLSWWQVLVMTLLGLSLVGTVQR